MSEAVYIACGLTSVFCAALIFLQYRRQPSHLLLWSSIAFFLLALSNLFLIVDLVILPQIDLSGPFWRGAMTMVAGLLLLFGLIMELV